MDWHCHSQYVNRLKLQHLQSTNCQSTNLQQTYRHLLLILIHNGLAIICLMFQVLDMAFTNGHACSCDSVWVQKEPSKSFTHYYVTHFKNRGFLGQFKFFMSQTLMALTSFLPEILKLNFFQRVAPKLKGLWLRLAFRWPSSSLQSKASVFAWQKQSIPEGKKYSLLSTELIYRQKILSRTELCALHFLIKICEL